MLVVTPILKAPPEQWVRGFWLVFVTSVTLLLHAPTHIDNASSLRFCEGVGCFVLLNHASFSTVCHICNIHISREYQPVSNIAPVVTKF